MTSLLPIVVGIVAVLILAIVNISQGMNTEAVNGLSLLGQSTKASYDNEYTGDWRVDNNGNLFKGDVNLSQKQDGIDKFTKDGIYAKAIKTSESKYAIVWVYNTDKSNLKDEIKKSLTSISNFSTKCETSYLRKYNFDVYEPSIKKKIKKSSKDYFE